MKYKKMFVWRWGFTRIKSPSVGYAIIKLIKIQYKVLCHLN